MFSSCKSQCYSHCDGGDTPKEICLTSMNMEESLGKKKADIRLQDALSE